MSEVRRQQLLPFSETPDFSRSTAKIVLNVKWKEG